MTDRDTPLDHQRRSLATESPLLTVVQRLTERGIIREDEAGDMFALLSAISGGATHRLPTRARVTKDGSEPRRHRLAQRIDKLL